MKRIILAFSLFAVTLMGGCGSCFGPSSPEEELAEKGFLDVMKEVSDDEYDPPADGKLTDQQVEMFLQVKEKEQELMKAAQDRLKDSAEDAKQAEEEGKGLTAAMRGLQTLGRAADLATLDIRAASELGHNTAEYSWVKGQIMEATLSTYSQNMQDSLTRNLEANLNTMKAAREKAPNDSARQAYDAQIAALEKSLEESKRAKAEASGDREAIEYNQKLLEKYGDQIKMLQNELQRFQGIGR